MGKRLLKDNFERIRFSIVIPAVAAVSKLLGKSSRKRWSAFKMFQFKAPDGNARLVTRQ